MRTQAADSALANVRERCLRSAEAWTHMAERAERQEKGRENVKQAAFALQARCPAE